MTREREGSKRQRTPGVWELRVYIGRDAKGRPAQRSRTFRGTERGAQRALDALVDETATLNDGGDVRTIRGLSIKWMEHLRAIGRAEYTLEGYQSKLDTHILPAVGRLPVDKLTAMHLDDLYGTLARDGKVRSVPQVHAVIRSMLSQAVKWRLVAENEAKRATLPTVPPLEPWAPPEETARGLLEAVAAHQPDLGAYLLLTADLGARRAEPLALRWPDVDFDRAEVDVSRTLEYTKAQRAAGEGPREKPTKTHASGVIPVTEGTVAALRAVRERQQALAKTAAVVVSPRAFVFADFTADLHGLAPWKPDRVTQAVRRARARPELAQLAEVEKVTVKSLRHWMVSSLAARGMLAQAMQRARHRNIATTQRYMAVVAARRREGADVMAEVLAFPGGDDPPGVSSRDEDAGL